MHSLLQIIAAASNCFNGHFKTQPRPSWCGSAGGVVPAPQVVLQWFMAHPRSGSTSVGDGACRRQPVVVLVSDPCFYLFLSLLLSKNQYFKINFKNIPQDMSSTGGYSLCAILTTSSQQLTRSEDNVRVFSSVFQNCQEERNRKSGTECSNLILST